MFSDLQQQNTLHNRYIYFSCSCALSQRNVISQVFLFYKTDIVFPVTFTVRFKTNSIGICAEITNIFHEFFYLKLFYNLVYAIVLLFFEISACDTIFKITRLNFLSPILLPNVRILHVYLSCSNFRAFPTRV